MQEDKEVRVRDRARAGGAQETKMSAEQKDLQGPARHPSEVVAGGPSQEEAQKIRDGVGLTPQEIQAINQPGQPRSRSRFKVPEQAVNVGAALGTTIGGGVGLVLLAQDALRNTPPAVVQEQKPDPKRDSPPADVVFPENDPIRQAQGGPFGYAQGGRADAPVTEVKPTRIFIPMVTKNFGEQQEPETPLYLREFGAPERGVVMRNRVEQGGGSLAYVEMGDQELWNNLMYLRETYGRRDLKLEISFYSTKGLLLRDPDAPRWVQENHRGALIYDSWAGGNGTFQNGSILFRYNEESKTLQFYITLPETNRGKTPTQEELDLLHLFFLYDISDRIFASNERGYSNMPYPIEPGSSVAQDLDAHRPVTYTDGNTNSALWVKMETVPTYGGKSK